MRYFLFVSAWTVALLPILMFFFIAARNSVGASVLTHIILYVDSTPACLPPNLTTFLRDSLLITWVLWLTASAALTESIGGGLNCSTNDTFAYCGQVNALVAFGWITWYVFVLVCGIDHYVRLTDRPQDLPLIRTLCRHSARHSHNQARRRLRRQSGCCVNPLHSLLSEF